MDYNKPDVRQIKEEILVMLKQESAAYVCGNYLGVPVPPSPQKRLQDQTATEIRTVQNANSPRSVRHQHLHEKTMTPFKQRQEPAEFFAPKNRAAIVQYCYRVCDFCGYPREVAQIGINYFDRFLDTNRGWKWLDCTHQTQQGTFINLIFMTALYIAIKIHGPEALSVNVFADLSRGKFTYQQIQYMERAMLHALDWRVNPPTGMAFARHLVNLIPPDLVTPLQKEEIFELTRLQIEMTVADYSFVTTRASTTAICCLNIALQSLSLNDKKIISPKVANQVADIFANAIPNFDLHSAKVQEIQDRICLGIANNYFHMNEDDLYQDNEIAWRIKSHAKDLFTENEDDDDTFFRYSVSSSESPRDFSTILETCLNC